MRSRHTGRSSKDCAQPSFRPCSVKTRLYCGGPWLVAIPASVHGAGLPVRLLTDCGCSCTARRGGPSQSGPSLRGTAWSPAAVAGRLAAESWQNRGGTVAESVIIMTLAGRRKRRKATFRATFAFSLALLVRPCMHRDRCDTCCTHTPPQHTAATHHRASLLIAVASFPPSGTLQWHRNVGRVTQRTTPAKMTAGDDATVPTPRDLDELVQLLRKELGDGGLTDLDAAGLARVTALMTNYKVRRRRAARGRSDACVRALTRWAGRAAFGDGAGGVPQVQPNGLEKVRQL